MCVFVVTIFFVPVSLTTCECLLVLMYIWLQLCVHVLVSKQIFIGYEKEISFINNILIFFLYCLCYFILSCFKI